MMDLETRRRAEQLDIKQHSAQPNHIDAKIKQGEDCTLKNTANIGIAFSPNSSSSRFVFKKTLLPLSLFLLKK